VQQGSSGRLDGGWKREVIPPAAPVTTATFPTLVFARASEEMAAYGRCWRGRVEIPNSVGFMVAFKDERRLPRGPVLIYRFWGFLAGNTGIAQPGFVNERLEG
jgi:hypothetical protein